MPLPINFIWLKLDGTKNIKNQICYIIKNKIYTDNYGYRSDGLENLSTKRSNKGNKNDFKDTFHELVIKN